MPNTRTNRTLIRSAVALTLVVVAAAVILLVALAYERPSDDPGDDMPVTTTTTTTSATAPTTKETSVTEDDGPVEGVEALPYQVQVYTSVARDMLSQGAFPRSRVTTAYVISDIQANYGISLTDAEAEVVVKEILR